MENRPNRCVSKIDHLLLIRNLQAARKWKCNFCLLIKNKKVLISKHCANWTETKLTFISNLYIVFNLFKPFEVLDKRIIRPVLNRFHDCAKELSLPPQAWLIKCRKRCTKMFLKNQTKMLNLIPKTKIMYNELLVKKYDVIILDFHNTFLSKLRQTNLVNYAMCGWFVVLCTAFYSQ